MSQPDCMDKWNWGHRLGSLTISRQNSSVTIRGSRLPSRTRRWGTARHTAPIITAGEGFPGRSTPQEAISIPVTTISR